ncbi:hypothetical protein THAOC_26369 [Thalassiosira oceanica]|uniref:Uncharacterized protein n=1 Tax=Thalassiosira oceanica TaxID=159749 RepID=K0RZ21_THAOC|nr:hypothetical protein THAOC_26369 [Thalassiosira oceanica]|eukprot:EJK54076.1 hypothetical protein THAOC_26369 [Thalassiosira oceanica]
MPFNVSTAIALGDIDGKSQLAQLFKVKQPGFLNAALPFAVPGKSSLCGSGKPSMSTATNQAVLSPSYPHPLPPSRTVSGWDSNPPSKNGCPSPQPGLATNKASRPHPLLPSCPRDYDKAVPIHCHHAVHVHCHQAVVAPKTKSQ